MIEDYDNVDYDYFKEWDIKQYKQEIEQLNNNIDKAIEYMNEVLECNYHGGNVTFDALVHNTEHILKGSDKE